MRIFRLFLLVSFLVLSLTNCGGQVNPTITKLRDTSEHARLQSFRQTFWDKLPQPIGWTNDYEGLFTPEQKNVLDDTIAAFQKETAIQICIVTLDTIYTTKQKFNDLALHIANVWGVGQGDKNNGVLICMSAGYRMMRICNGKGIEKILTNDETKKIITDHLVPSFRKANYFEGTFEGLNALIKILRERAKDI